MSQKSELEERFLRILKAHVPKIAEPERGFKFHPERRWKCDFVWHKYRLVVEIEGRGRHQTYAGFCADCEKYNALLLEGYNLLRFAEKHMPMSQTPLGRARRWEMVDTVVRAMGFKGLDG